MIAELALAVLAQVTPTSTPPPGWWNCANQCAPCPPNTKPYITYTDPYGRNRYMAFDATIWEITVEDTCETRWDGQGGPDHADQGLGHDCKIYALHTHAPGATWDYPAPPPEADLCGLFATYQPGVTCPTASMAAYSKRMQSNPVWIESVNTYKPQIDAECKGIAPTFTKGPSWTPTIPASTTRAVTPTPAPPITPDPCIMSGRTCTPTPRSTIPRTATPVPATPTTTPQSARFQITVKWTAPDGRTGAGVPISCGSSAGSSGDLSVGFWFFSQSNVELFISVLPSYCSTHPNVMVKLMGATNVKVEIVVTDHQTGASHTYVNPQGQMFVSVIDTGSLPCR